MSIAWIRDNYGVPAKVGGRVEYTPCEGSKDDLGKFGTITGSHGPYLRVRLDGATRSGAYHPTWQIRYVALSSLPEEKKPS